MTFHSMFPLLRQMFPCPKVSNISNKWFRRTRGNYSWTCKIWQRKNQITYYCFLEFNAGNFRKLRSEDNGAGGGHVIQSPSISSVRGASKAASQFFSTNPYFQVTLQRRNLEKRCVVRIIILLTQIRYKHRSRRSLVIRCKNDETKFHS